MARTRRAGLTLIEVVVATGLLSLVVVALVKLVATSLDVWDATETRRDLSERARTTSELLAGDLVALEAGPNGDLLCDWGAHDLDGDGIAGLLAQRVRLVRRVSAAELARRSDTPDGAAAGRLVEVAWVHVPAEGRLLRGERAAGGPDSFLFADFFDARQRPPDGATEELSRSVLWMELLFASQATTLGDGWRTGSRVTDCGSAWDARTRGRTDVELTQRNLLPAGTPRSEKLPVFPRRVQLALELERPTDLERRTRLATPAAPGDLELVVVDARFAPPAGAFARIGEEWVEVTNVSGKRLTVARGARGTRPIEHPAGERVHFGKRSVREIAIPVYREDWNL